MTGVQTCALPIYLFFGVIKSSSKDEKLIDLIRERGDRSGIVYCATRKNVESVCELLCDNGFSAARYHAGLDEYERRKNQGILFLTEKILWLQPTLSVWELTSQMLHM